MKKIMFNDDWRWKKESETAFQNITLPHDAMLTEERTPDAPSQSGGAFFPGGKYVYEKLWEAPEEWRDEKIALEFEGVYQKSEVYVNGTKLGGCIYGYVPFYVDITSAVKFGQINTITVTVDNLELPNSRWYSGSGIYRPVKLLHSNKEYIAYKTLHVDTIGIDPARIRVTGQVIADSDTAVTIQIMDDKKVLAEKETATGTDGSFALELEIEDAKLWSEDQPKLYQCCAVLKREEQILDQDATEFGIRSLEWSTKGLFVNGVETLLRGGCIHHDNGVLGAATYEEAEYRRIRKLKEMGYNAIRSSHNPASEAMLRACDHYGIYVMDETWDMWYEKKNKHDYSIHFSEHYKEDIYAMVQQDYNHPSVLMYSIGNEVSEPRDEKGVSLEKEMTAYVHSLDSTRAVTAGMNLMLIDMASKGKGIYKEDGGRADQEKKSKKKKKESASGSLFFNMMTSMIGTNMTKMTGSKSVDRSTTPALDALDIAGYNYATGRYGKDGTLHPDRIIVGSETFPMDIAKNWEYVKTCPYIIGDFMWTAWDYLGEAGIGAWTYDSDGESFNKEYPWLLADVGAFDILGKPGAEAYYAKTVWGLSKKPYIGVRPVCHSPRMLRKATWRGSNAFDSWSYEGCQGNKAEVEVYADAAMIELKLNGKSLGKKKVKQYKTLFKIKYEPGTLTAIAYDRAGNKIAEHTLDSASGEKRLRISPEKDSAKQGEVLFVPIEVVGANGIVESNRDTDISVSVTGGTLLGFGSARPKTEESYLSATCKSYYGRTLAVIRADKEGTVEIEAKTAGMQGDSVSIHVSAV